MKRYLSILIFSFLIVLSGSVPQAYSMEGSFFIGNGGTGEKPQSKLWINDGTWWAIMFDGTNNYFYKMVNGTFVKQSFPGALVNSSSSARADVLWNGTHLFVLMYHPTATKLYKYNYDPSSQSYSLLSGFPVSITLDSGSETAVIAQDSTGKLWITYETNSQIRVIWSTSSDHLNWNLAGAVLYSGVDSDDISSIVSFNNQIGVMWSNQQEFNFGFRVHVDGDPETTWGPVEVITGPGGIADDHINLAVTDAGEVLAITKSQEDEVNLFIRSPFGWEGPYFVAENVTRAIGVFDQGNQEIYVLYTDIAASPNTIAFKSAYLDELIWSPQTVLMQVAGTNLNDVSSTKQMVNDSTELLAIAKGGAQAYYNSIDILPVGMVRPSARFSAEPTSGLPPLTVQFIDASTGEINQWLWDFGDGSTSFEQNPIHIYSSSGTYTVRLTIQGPTGSSTETKFNFITVLPIADSFIHPIPPEYSSALMQDFGNEREEFSGAHSGEDWFVYTQNVPVVAVANGIVEYSKDFDSNFGNVIILKHLLPDLSIVYTLYGHLATPVKSNFPAGRLVTQGEVLGTVGETGVAPSGYHIHFEIRKDVLPLEGYADSLTGYVDPSDFLLSHSIHTPDVIIVDNDDSVVTLTGSWFVQEGSLDSYSVNNFVANPGSGSGSTTWNFKIFNPGIYNVYAWWTGFVNQATNAKYTVTHAGGSSTITKNQSQNSGKWNLLGTFPFNSGSYQITLSDLANGVVSADAIKVVLQGAVDTCSDGTPFGEPSAQIPKYCLVNDFLIDKSLKYGCVVGVPQTDGTCTKTESGIIVDNADPGFSATGSWSVKTGIMGFYGWDYLEAPAGSGESTATWQATIPVSGSYKVFAWSRDKFSFLNPSQRATNAPFTITHKLGSSTVFVNQRNIFKNWIPIGNFYFDGGSTAIISLTNNANGAVVADAVRLTFLGSGPPPPVAEFTATPTAGNFPLVVQFTDQSLGEVNQWNWDFGDGTTSTLQNPVHTYNAIGTYTVSLTVTGPNGTDTKVKEAFITVTSSVQLTVDNGGAGFSVIGSWPNSTLVPGYYGTNYQFNEAGLGNDKATWTFNIPVAGNYRVSAWWSAPYSTRPSNAPYTIHHYGGSTTVRVDQRINGSQWNQLGVFYFNPGTATVTLSDNADGTVVADAVQLIFIEVGFPPTVAEFTATPTTGTFPLTVQFTDQSVGGVNQWIWDFGDDTTSTLQNPAHTYNAIGTYTVSLTVTGPNGTDTRVKEALITVTPVQLTVDNGGAGFSVIGSWPNSTAVPGYYGTNYQFNEAGLGNDKATWTFNIPVAGNYRVSAWWSAPYSTRPSNAPYTIHHYGGSTTVRVDQRINGSQWNQLGVFYFNPGTATVTLSDNADGTVVADAVQLVLIDTGTPPPLAEFIATPTTGTFPLTVQFTDQSLGEVNQWNWDFGDGTTSTLQNPAHTYNAIGTYTVSLTVTGPTGTTTRVKEGLINATGPVQLIIDNGGAGFSVIGTWPNSTAVPGYYGTNYQFNEPGSGNHRATWTFNIPVAGNYRVSAWWSAPYSTRPSNAPYTIHHYGGSTTVRVDQRINGSQWNQLGVFYFNPGTATVTLSDNADGTVVADAVLMKLLP